MAAPLKLVRIPSLKSVADFRSHVASLGIELPCDDQIQRAPESPLACAVALKIFEVIERERLDENARKLGDRLPSGDQRTLV